MVGRNWLEGRYHDPLAERTSVGEPEGYWRDYILAPVKGVGQIGAFTGSAVRYLGEAGFDPEKPSEEQSRVIAGIGELIHHVFSGLDEGVTGLMSEKYQRGAEASINEAEFWYPSNLIKNGLVMVPQIASAAAVAYAFPGTAPALATALIQGGVFAAGSTAESIFEITDARSDEQLQQESPYYKELRDSGLDEDAARIGLTQTLMGNKVAIASIVGAVANTFGPAGQAARLAGGGSASLFRGKVGEGVTAKIAKGVAEGAASEFIDEGSQNILAQQAEIDYGSRDEIDYDQAGLAASSGAVLGGLLGGAVGGAAGASRPRQGEEAIPDTTAVPVVENVAPDQAAALEASKSQSAPPPATADAPQPLVTPLPTEAATVQQAPEQEALQSTPDEAAPLPDQSSTGLSEMGSGMAQAMGENLRERMWAEYEGREASIDPIARRARKEAPGMSREEFIAWVENPPARPVAPPQQVTPEGNAAQQALSMPTIDEAAPAVADRQVGPVSARPRDAGPRILEDRTGPDYTQAWRDRQEQNLREPETKEPSPSKRGREEVEARNKTNQFAKEVFGKHQPSEAENGIFSRRPAEVNAAKTPIMERAKAIHADALEAGVIIPQALRDTKDKSLQYNAETALLMEARRLATRENPTLKDFRRFRQQEIDIALGRDALTEARRAEGDAAMKRRVEDGGDAEAAIDRAAVQSALTDTENPETALIRAEERGNRSRDKRATEDIKMPARVQKAVDDAIEAAKRKPKAPKVVEVVKRRKVSRPVEKAVETATEKVSPKVTDRIKETKARIAAARAKTNTNPSEAQKVAGNYEKGSVSVQGMTVKLENPKGSTRSGVDPDGKPWSVKLKHDYGYIAGTKGADGDAIDVYLGNYPDATYVYVVDQVDADTRAFDEHKVLMNFRDDGEAFLAYAEAFSDGRGADRMGDMRRMTVDEFKRWAQTNPKDRAAATEADLAEVQSFLIEEAIAPSLPRRVTNETPAVLPTGTVADPYSERIVRPVASQTAADAMGGFNFSNLNPYQRAIAGQARRMMSELVGDTPVHFITLPEMTRITGRNDVRGVYSADAQGNSAVFIRSDLMGDPDALRHAVMHETIHAASLQAIRNSPDLQNDIRDVMMATVDGLESLQVLDDGSLDYALTDPTEFVAEVLSNPRVQQALANMIAPDALVQRLGIQRGRIRSAWDALVHTIRKALNLPGTATSMLEAAMRVSERSIPPRLLSDEGGQSFLIDGNLKPLQKSMVQKTKALLERPELQASEGKPWLYRLRTMDSLARASDRLFGGADNNPIRRIAQLIEAQRVRATKHYEDATPLLQKTHELQRRFSKERGEGGQSVWDNFAALTIDETTSEVYADRPLSEQKHITKGSHSAWQRKQYPELARRYNALPAELKAHRQEMLDYFKGQQRKLALGNIENRILALFDASGAEGGVSALALRIHDKKVTDADKALLGEDFAELQRAGVLSKIDGPYFPLMRRGNWVVEAYSEVTPPGNARQVSPTVFEFTSEAEAEAFSVAQDGRPTLAPVYVDPNTNETFGIEDGQQVRLTAQDMNVEQRWRVTVQNKHIEMFDSQSEARAQAAELERNGLRVANVAPRDFNIHGPQAEALSPQIARMVQVIERRADARGLTPEQKAEMVQSLTELSLQAMGSTRIQTRSLPRKNVAGASKDLTRNVHDYALAMGNHLAKTEFSPQINAALADATDYIKENRHDNRGGARQMVYNEVATRVTMKDPRTEGGLANTFVNRILALSFIDKLASPSYSVINATQPSMITTPYLAAHYGVGRAMGAMSKAYRDIGSMEVIRQGARDAARKARSGEIIPTDPISIVLQRLTNPREKEAIQFFVEKGALDTDAGLEVSKLVQSRKGFWGRADVGLSYLEGIARQLPKAVEVVNRSVSGLAAYRLEFDRSGDHNKAMQFAYDTINLTQFNYSHTNANRLMNHPMLRIATQFKKYGIGMYQFLGEQAGIAINATSTPAERAAAIKALSYTIGMHFAIAGAMGLPTEPIKLVVTLANAMGVWDWTWTDVEIGQREAMAGLFGRDLGEALSRGIPRLAGLDLSTRMGIDTLMGPFGEPRSNEAQDLKAYMWDALAGAPAGLIFDMTGGVGSLVQGDVVRGMEKLVPIKAFSDTLKSYRMMTEGNISKSGKQTMSPYSVGEAALRSIGFTPAREAEAFERRNMFYHSRTSQEDRRRDYQREWSEANGAARGRIWREIQKWNKNQPREVRLSLSDLRKYKTRLERDARETREGLRARRREKHILNRVDSLFNYEP